MIFELKSWIFLGIEILLKSKKSCGGRNERILEPNDELVSFYIWKLYNVVEKMKDMICVSRITNFQMM